METQQEEPKQSTPNFSLYRQAAADRDSSEVSEQYMWS